MRNIINELIKSNFYFLLDKYGFFLIKESISDDLGNSFVVLESKDFKLRFIMDRGEYYIEIGSVCEKSEWYDLNIVRSLIDGSDIMQMGSIENLSIFFKTNYSVIKDLFNPKNIQRTRKKLKNIEQLKMKKMFPNLQI